MMVLGFYSSKSTEKPQASYLTKCLLSSAVQPPKHSAYHRYPASFFCSQLNADTNFISIRRQRVEQSPDLSWGFPQLSTTPQW